VRYKHDENVAAPLMMPILIDAGKCGTSICTSAGRRAALLSRRNADVVGCGEARESASSLLFASQSGTPSVALDAEFEDGRVMNQLLDGRLCERGSGAKKRSGKAERPDLSDEQACLFQTIPLRGRIPGGAPTDPSIYRFYEMIQIYGTTLKALLHEQFRDGIISAINFKLDIKKVPDPDGGESSVITLDGQYLPAKPF
jgi:cyanate lyase